MRRAQDHRTDDQTNIHEGEHRIRRTPGWYVAVFSIAVMAGGPIPATSQAVFTVGARALASTGSSFGANVTSYSMFAEAVPTMGLGGSLTLDHHRLGIACATACSGGAWAGWMGVVGAVPVGPIGLRAIGEVGATVWGGEWKRAIRTTAWVRFPRGREWQLEAGIGRVDLPPMDRERVLALGVTWQPHE